MIAANTTSVAVDAARNLGVPVPDKLSECPEYGAAANLSYQSVQSALYDQGWVDPSLPAGTLPPLLIYSCSVPISPGPHRLLPDGHRCALVALPPAGERPGPLPQRAKCNPHGAYSASAPSSNCSCIPTTRSWPGRAPITASRFRFRTACWHAGAASLAPTTAFTSTYATCESQGSTSEISTIRHHPFAPSHSL